MRAVSSSLLPKWESVKEDGELLTFAVARARLPLPRVAERQLDG